jgi:hypothetical protein
MGLVGRSAEVELIEALLAGRSPAGPGLLLRGDPASTGPMPSTVVSRRCCIKRSSRSPTAKLPVRSNSAAQLGRYDRDKSGPLAGSVRRQMAVLPPVFSLVVENLRRRDRAMA